MNEIIDQNKELSTTKIDPGTTEKKPGKKPRTKGTKLLVAGIVVAIVFGGVSIGVKYNLPVIIENIWREIWESQISGLFPTDY